MNTSSFAVQQRSLLLLAALVCVPRFAVVAQRATGAPSSGAPIIRTTLGAVQGITLQIGRAHV